MFPCVITGVLLYHSANCVTISMWNGAGFHVCLLLLLMTSVYPGRNTLGAHSVSDKWYFVRSPHAWQQQEWVSKWHIVLAIDRRLGNGAVENLVKLHSNWKNLKQYLSVSRLTFGGKPSSRLMSQSTTNHKAASEHVFWLQSNRTLWMLILIHGKECNFSMTTLMILPHYSSVLAAL